MSRDQTSRIRVVAAAALVAAALVLAGRAGATAARALQLGASGRAAVAVIAGTGVRSRCTIPPGDAGLVEVLGHADWDRRLIELRPAICRNVNALGSAPATAYSGASFAQAQAFLVLVHESVHLSEYDGARDEALTECRAIQLMRETALTIGVDDATARALGHESLRYDARLPRLGDWRVGLNEIPNYHSEDCYDGGPLDIHPDSSDWPN
jgi:hypothetical protein